MVSLDIAAAFDNAWWPLIIQRLKLMDVDETTIDILRDYFRDRFVHLVLGETTLDVPQTKGCIQGSVLGPLLWNLIVDDLLEKMDLPNIRIQAYADNICLLAYGDSYAECEKYMQRALKVFENWAYKCKLQVSPEKTSLIAFRSQKASREVVLTLLGEKINETYSLRYLGMETDKLLTWIPHIRKQMAKVSVLYHRLAPLVTRAYGPSPECMRLLLEGAIVPKLIYGSPVLRSALTKVTNLNGLRKVHRQWLIRVYRMFSSTSYAKALILSSSLSIDRMIENRSRIYDIKRSRMVQNNLFDRKIIDMRKPRRLLPPWSIRNICSKIADGLIEVNIEEVTIFTDGSKIEDKVGAAYLIIHGHNEIRRQKIKLADHCSVF